ncbi:MAG: hypothetical protein WA988_20560, partial [Candidatus Nanopelagicales bacterium]
RACAARLHELGWLRGQGYLFGHAEPMTVAAGLTSSRVPTQRPRAVPNPTPQTTNSGRTARGKSRRSADRSA